MNCNDMYVQKIPKITKKNHKIFRRNTRKINSVSVLSRMNSLSKLMKSNFPKAQKNSIKFRFDYLTAHKKVDRNVDTFIPFDKEKCEKKLQKALARTYESLKKGKQNKKNMSPILLELNKNIKINQSNIPKDASGLSEYKGLIPDKMNEVPSKKVLSKVIMKCYSKPNVVFENKQKKHLSFCVIKLNQNFHNTIKMDWTIRENSAESNKDTAIDIKNEQCNKFFKLLKAKKIKSMQTSKRRILSKLVQQKANDNSKSLPRISTQRLGIQKDVFPTNEKKIEKKAIQCKPFRRHNKSYSSVTSYSTQFNNDNKNLEVSKLYHELHVSHKESLMLIPKITIDNKLIFGLKLSTLHPLFIEPHPNLNH